jgi:hypothetical protein
MASAPVPAAPIEVFRNIPTAVVKPATTPPVGGATAMAAIANATAASAPASTRSPNEIVATAFADAPPTPKFQSLYQSDENGPVGPMVRELWGTRRAAAAETASAITPAANAQDSSASGSSLNAPLDLFQFLRPSARRPA